MRQADKGHIRSRLCVVKVDLLRGAQYGLFPIVIGLVEVAGENQ